MIYDMLEERLIAAGFEPGITLFRETLPADVSVGAFLRIPLSGVPVDGEMRNWYRCRMQLITRHTDVVAGYELAVKAGQAVTILTRIDAPASAERGAAHITQFIPQTLPVRFPALEGNAYEWSQYFSASFAFEPKA